MTDPQKISIQDYTYKLPDERIASHPLAERDASKLLVYKNETIKQDIYANISNHLPAGSLLVFNDTRVINARITFQKLSGGKIEIFCLEPMEMLNEYATVMNKTGSCKWKCFVGGAAKWKEEVLTKELAGNLFLKARMVERRADAFIIEFSWNPADLSFAEVLQEAGDIPLPPYIKREPDKDDLDRYQTIYAIHNGSVAAPTAGLHFTEKIFTTFEEVGIDKEYVTLHVGAGTFKPVKADIMENHEMHAEWIDVSKSSLKKILSKQGNIIAVGTTSARTLESLYWLGVKLLVNPSLKEVDIQQWDVYQEEMNQKAFSLKESFGALLSWMEKEKRDRLVTTTQLLIVPGYRFKVIRGIITNFHQPKSTLLLLVAAATNGNWKSMYQYALDNNFRFLSYGDGNLIFI